MTDLDGNVIQDSSGHIGFPGFDAWRATVSLAWVAQMQEAGIPITYAYISDAHDGHGTAGNIHFAYGPGEAGYVQQLQAYDTAFQSSLPGWRQMELTGATHCSYSRLMKATTLSVMRRLPLAAMA